MTPRECRNKNMNRFSRQAVCVLKNEALPGKRHKGFYNGNIILRYVDQIPMVQSYANVKQYLFSKRGRMRFKMLTKLPLSQEKTLSPKLQELAALEIK